MAGGIRGGINSYGIIDVDDKSEEKITRYCPNCNSILRDWIIEQGCEKRTKTPGKLQCHTCGEIVSLYHDSALS